MPPISVYRIGDLHFVRDGHHRVSVALALGHTVIEAHVTEVLTQIPAAGISDRGDLVVKDYERLFRQRVPLPDEMAARIVCRDPWNYAELSENVEAWSFRLVQDAGEYLSRAEAARRWYDDEYRPVVAMLHEADLVGRGTEAEAYLRVACDRYRLIRAHEWSDEIVARLRRAAVRRRRGSSRWPVVRGRARPGRLLRRPGAAAGRPRRRPRPSRRQVLADSGSKTCTLRRSSQNSSSWSSFASLAASSRAVTCTPSSRRPSRRRRRPAASSSRCWARGPLALHREVGVLVRAERLEQVDVRANDGALIALVARPAPRPRGALGGCR